VKATANPGIGQATLRAVFGLPDRADTVATFRHKGADVWTTSATITIVADGPGAYTFSADCGEVWAYDRMVVEEVVLDCVQGRPAMALTPIVLEPGTYLTVSWPIKMWYGR
jgi:hypothetical protein